MKYFRLFTILVVLSLGIYGCSQKENKNDLDNEIQDNQSISEEKLEISDEYIKNQNLKTEYPLTIEVFDNEGNIYTQTYNEKPKRAITNNQASTELLLELGLEEYMIGTGDLDNQVLPHLQDSYDKIPAVSEKGQVAKEVVVGANPEIVIGRAMSFTDETYGTINSLNEMGINTYVQFASRMNVEQSLENIILDVRNIGKIFDIQDRADEFAISLQQRMDNIQDKLKNIDKDPVKVVFMVKYIDGTFSAYGANSSLQTKMLDMMNAVNVVEKGGSLSAENLIALNPDIIVYVTADKNQETDKAAIEHMLNNETIQSVTAIQNKKVVQVQYTELMGYGFRTFDCMEKIAKEIYPDIFE